jgi:hypothetical protein
LTDKGDSAIYYRYFVLLSASRFVNDFSLTGRGDEASVEWSRVYTAVPDVGEGGPEFRCVPDF